MSSEGSVPAVPRQTITGRTTGSCRRTGWLRTATPVETTATPGRGTIAASSPVDAITGVGSAQNAANVGCASGECVNRVVDVPNERAGEQPDDGEWQACRGDPAEHDDVGSVKRGKQPEPTRHP